MTGSAQDQKIDAKFYGVNAQYNYPLSKRTVVYAGASYGKTKIDGLTSELDQEKETSQGYVGLAHFF